MGLWRRVKFCCAVHSLLRMFCPNCTVARVYTTHVPQTHFLHRPRLHIHLPHFCKTNKRCVLQLAMGPYLLSMLRGLAKDATAYPLATAAHCKIHDSIPQSSDLSDQTQKECNLCLKTRSSGEPKPSVRRRALSAGTCRI